MTAGTKWILAITTLLGLNILATVILIVVANGHGHSRVLPSYKFESTSKPSVVPSPNQRDAPIDHSRVLRGRERR